MMSNGTSRQRRKWKSSVSFTKRHLNGNTQPITSLHQSKSEMEIYLFELLNISRISSIKRCIIFCREKFKISTVEAVISKASEIPVALPSLPQLREIVTKAKNWQEKATNFQDPKTTFLDDLITVVDIGEALPIELEYMKALQSQISAANVWRENCMKVFLKRNSTIDLIEALLPRKTISKVPQRGKKKRVSSEGPPLTFIANILGIPPPDVKSESCMTNAYWVSKIFIFWQFSGF